VPGRLKLTGLKLTKKASTVLLLGAGRMGLALLKGWLAGKVSPIVIVEPNPSPELLRVARARRIPLHDSLGAVDPAGVAIVVIAIKPQILKSEAASLQPFARAGALLLSIAAGTSIRSLTQACGRTARIVRAMPNLPGAIGQGISALYAPKKIAAAERARAEVLLTALGETVWVAREELIDAVTAVSGSGPAYFFLLAEALAAAGRREGLPKALADRLARATLAGAGALTRADVRDPAELRRDVTSPGGTTAAALAEFMKDDAFAELVARAVAAARRRSEELRG
jgi:pyrroline-5-carboxylate reductase